MQSLSNFPIKNQWLIELVDKTSFIHLRFSIIPLLKFCSSRTSLKCREMLHEIWSRISYALCKVTVHHWAKLQWVGKASSTHTDNLMLSTSLALG